MKPIRMNIIAGTLIGASAMIPTFKGQALTIEDYCNPAINAPKSIRTITPMNDGETYSAISEDSKGIDVYSYKTGERQASLFNIDQVKGDIKISEFDGYQLCANEKKILLWTNKERIYRHSFYADYYVYDILRSTLKKVSYNGKLRGAVISHDGRMVAYERDNNVWLSNLDYGTDLQITTDGEKNKIINGSSDWSYEEEFGLVNTIRWNNDDTVLAYLRFDESDVPVYSFDNYRSYCSSDPSGDLYPLQYSYKYPLAGFPNSKVTVKAYNIDTRVTKTMDIPVGTDYVPSIEFDGTGQNIMVMILNRDQNNLCLYKANPGSTVARPVYTEKSSAWLSPDAYQMVSYDKDSFIIGSDRSGYRHLYEYDYNGNFLNQISSGEWNVTAYYGKDIKTGRHYFQSTICGPQNRNVTYSGGKSQAFAVNSVEGTENAIFSKSMKYYVRNFSSSVTPNQYSICETSGKKIATLEMNEEYASKYSNIPKKEFLTIKNNAGMEMNAYLIKPVDFDANRKYPLLMYQYNGPESQEVLNRWKMEGIYYLASQGYIVACVDGRGTGNRSRDWATVVYKNLGKFETEDQLDAAVYLAKQSYIDPSRIACFGWSYGGYMTLMEMSAGKDTFKAGVAMAPVTDWRFYDSIYTERYMLTPAQNQSGYILSSALERSSALKGRLLIMSGTSDDNVHFYNTLKYTSKLGSEGTVYDMMAFTGFEHSLPMCNARVELFKKIKDFLDVRL